VIIQQHPPAIFLSLASARSLGMMASGVMEPEPTPDALPVGTHIIQRGSRQQ
jgi:hypothetical protein